MKKLIEMTPEWVLENLSDTLYADGCGIMTVFTDSVTNARLMLLALNTLNIPFEEYENGNNEDITIWYEFKVADIKIDCPSLYEDMMKFNSLNLEYKLNRNIGLN